MRQAPRRSAPRVLLVLLAVSLAVPLLAAVGALREPRWYPSADDAQTELRVRDVWTEDPPLVGLGGRIGVFGADQGSHPGPLSFYALSVPYRGFGSDSWALHIATAVLNIVALAMALWLARRRGGIGLVLGAALAVGILAQAYGGYVLTLPWNPYLPILWWVVVVLGVWGLVCRDLAVLPATVFAASFCMQTHISYVGLVAVLAGVGLIAVVAAVGRGRGDRLRLRRDLRWVAAGVVLAAVLWFPPVAEQVTRSQGGNLSTLVRHFGDPPEEPYGLRRGFELVVADLDPWRLLTEPVVEGRPFLGGPKGPGLVLLAAWVAAVGVALRLRHAALVRLHLVLAVALGAGIASVSRIFGAPFTYLALWAWGLGALIGMAVAWTACALLDRLVPSSARRQLGAAGAALGVAALAAVLVAFTLDARKVDNFQPQLSVSMDRIVPPTAVALERDGLPGTGPDGRYLVTWSDPEFLDGRGFSLFNELDRLGFDVGAGSAYRAATTRHRVLTRTEATAEVHLAVGPEVRRWRELPGFRQVAAFDPSGPSGRTEYERIALALDTELRRRDRPDLADLLQRNPRAVRYPGSGLPADLASEVDRMNALGAPVAIFVGPPE